MPLKRKATGDIYSKYSSESEDSESVLHSGSALRKVSLFNKKLEGMHLDLANTKSPKFGECEKQAGKDKVGISESNSRGLTKALVTQGSEKNNEECNSSSKRKSGLSMFARMVGYREVGYSEVGTLLFFNTLYYKIWYSDH
eukprot:TRINITY_DN881_c1_g1_i2.p1 TRINITY_DN881_c1_g1~~TRINITY_DN881_c1_g1_i2.p1  ORF type:complete len:141 (-),score=23.19 TRINITY_DN881_c1_g1_i2:359-781(-)